MLSVSGGKSLHVWIELCQKCRADPHNLVVKNVDKLFDLILEVTTLDPKVTRSLIHYVLADFGLLVGIYGCGFSGNGHSGFRSSRLGSTATHRPTSRRYQP